MLNYKINHFFLLKIKKYLNRIKMYQYRQSGNNKLENVGKLIVVVGAILGTIAFVLVLTRKCKEQYLFGCGKVQASDKPHNKQLLSEKTTKFEDCNGEWTPDNLSDPPYLEECAYGKGDSLDPKTANSTLAGVGPVYSSHSSSHNYFY